MGFCSGLLRLQGEARSFDVHCIIFESAKFLNRWDKFTEHVELMFMELLERVSEQADTITRHAQGTTQAINKLQNTFNFPDDDNVVDIYKRTDAATETFLKGNDNQDLGFAFRT